MTNCGLHLPPQICVPAVSVIDSVPLCVQDGQDIHDAPAYTKYISALHFATTTMATVGYGDVSPKNNVERLVAMMIMIAVESLTSDPLRTRASCPDFANLHGIMLQGLSKYKRRLTAAGSSVVRLLTRVRSVCLHLAVVLLQGSYSSVS